MRRFQLITLFGFLTLLFAATAASAQTGQLFGHVLLKQADGSTAPLPGAQIDVFRTDLKAKYSTTADKKGHFVYAGLPYVGDYIIAASAPNAAPFSLGKVKTGREIDFELVLGPGDGHRMTEDEAKAAAGGNSSSGEAAKASTGESAAVKAKREEELKKYEAEKNRVTNINEVMNRTFKAGKDALQAKNYDEAIKQFDEGLAADPDQVVFYSLKSSALRSRGVEHYNASVKGTDVTAKAAEMENAKKDFQAAADTANKGVEVAKKEQAATEPAAQTAQASRKLEILGYRAEAMRLLVKTDPSQASAAITAYQEYMAAESDVAKKAKAERDLAQILFDTASDQAGYDKALAAYQKILETTPDDPDALLRIGQTLFNIGALNNNDKAKYQEAANYLQRFVDKAPDPNPLKAEAKELIEALKAQANVTPEKINTPPRRRRP
jgi:tetratricopeptide (TPR) repeat protein